MILLSFLLLLQPYSSWTERITNRRYVSRILYEERAGKATLTLLTTHPRYWAFHSDLHALHYHCGNYGQCLDEMNRLNQHLSSGHNIGLTVHGSQVVKLRYLTSAPL